jgi:hypothetical protein
LETIDRAFEVCGDSKISRCFADDGKSRHPDAPLMTSFEFWTGIAGALLIAAMASSAGDTLRVCEGKDVSSRARKCCWRKDPS